MEATISRSDHLVWCKQRALEYVKMGDIQGAFASMVSDMRKHPGTADHAALELGLMMIMGGHLATRDAMQKFIEGFN